ncbi:MAG: hypothetical protein WAK55_12740 [Xanthobacteraceae bacterium]
MTPRRRAGRTGPPFKQRIPEEHLDRVALVRAVAGVEVAAHFERIELRVGDVDRAAMDAMAPPVAV